ncbi:histidine phosphatase family protein [Arthrobacter sp. zg-Y826]|uniref:histidine phosphatase family protein n=1 Tax=Arthrobacter jinronghuae TaxID=2964609 RepID=UPI0021080F05|nr:histidine phosphatase family protein [Arthrobacter jinronghuae]MCQ1957430.1 histidine phosphatase family protein [Arthrobacter jinronghuae]
MRNLYVVTHPEATHHVENLVGGWHDSALTSRGLADAQRAARAVRGRIPGDGGTVLFGSDLLRTRQTAEAVGELLGLETVFDPDLREQSYGSAEGTPAGTTPYQPPPANGDRMHHHDGNEGSETRFEWAGRAYRVLDRILATGARDMIVVTHGGTATYLIAAWIGMPLHAAGYVKFNVAPGSITHLREDDFYRDRQVVALSEVGHLG